MIDARPRRVRGEKCVWEYMECEECVECVGHVVRVVPIGMLCVLLAVLWDDGGRIVGV